MRKGFCGCIYVVSPQSRASDTHETKGRVWRHTRQSWRFVFSYCGGWLSKQVDHALSSHDYSMYNPRACSCHLSWSTMKTFLPRTCCCAFREQNREDIVELLHFLLQTCVGWGEAHLPSIVFEANGSQPVLPYIPASSIFCTAYPECTSSLDQAPQLLIEGIAWPRIRKNFAQLDDFFAVCDTGIGTMDTC